MADTIAAIATPPGQGGVGIIRISGSDAVAIAKKISKLVQFEPRKVYFTKFQDDKQNPIDEGLLIYFKKPNSFTGEDIIECHLHIYRFCFLLPPFRGLMFVYFQNVPATA